MKVKLRARQALMLFLSLVGSLVLLTEPGLAQERYFPEAGYVVEGEFLRFFEEHGGLRVFGYPISPSFKYGDLEVQYFQNGRLELASDGHAYLSLLPYELSLKRTEPINRQQVSAGGEYFPATGHSVVMAFLDLYLKYDGPELFGYPITELTNENDRLVQYFERGVFEWWPELPDGQRVQLSRLGESYFQSAHHDPALLFARIGPNDQSVTSIHVSAGVRAPIVGLDETQQVVYVHVRDQLGQALETAEVKAFVLWPDLTQRILITPAQLTNANGTAIFPFHISGLSTFSQLAAGDTIPIQIEASFDGHQSRTATAFGIWW
jgi:hypothetical protein